MKKHESPHQDQLSDVLRNLRERGDGFSTPSADYFTELAQRTIATQRDQERDFKVAKSIKGSKQSGRIRFMGPRLLAIAASFLLLFWWQPWSSESTSVDPVSSSPAIIADNTDWDAGLAELSDEDILAYIEDNISEFEIETLTDE